ncbi:hypothetical protein [Nonlabens marinus]|uniref:Uncharacterized protein n=1 Tax=Nonlabens marinus S1-08 TaxID=1454201 RepID=W8VUV7_9FLAO|nr:hypothetical protein [Nonlabens marinus]BAO54933.1 hypothetical protein NMS_0924 [Nonlabens marinus S1-08]
MRSTKIKPPVWFWIVAVILLLWNLIGLIAFGTEVAMPEALTAGFNEQQMEMYNNRPSWYMFNFAIAVISGTLSCILLLARKKFAVTLAVVSLISILISSAQTVYSGALELVGTVDQTLFYLVMLLDVVLVLFAIHASRKRWIS